MLPKLKYLLIGSLFCLSLVAIVSPVLAEQASPGNTTFTPPPPKVSPLVGTTTNVATTTATTQDYRDITEGKFVDDTEVTSVARAAIRSQDFLDWVLLHGRTTQNGDKPIKTTYQYVQYATAVLMVLVVVGIGFILMIRRNKDYKLIKLLPMLLILFSYIFLSYALSHGIYQLIERLMLFFLKLGENADHTIRFITTNDLLHIGFPYEGFDGVRRFGNEYDESASISLLLIRLTTWTYMTMSGILILRQIILWFFVIISPFLALLLPFPLIRNTGKIWIGEFFRWLFYGLLFAAFLRALVIIWRAGIPMQFVADSPDTWAVKYPTAINVLLAGPNYQIDVDKASLTSVNNIDTYANYVVALIMLWVVIILPWILLRIFRDMLSNWMKSDSGNEVMGKLGSVYSKYLKFPPGGSVGANVSEPVPPKEPSPAGTGRTLELPFRKVNIVARDVAVNQDIKNTISVDRDIASSATQELGRFMGMQIPKITDIAKMEMNKQNLGQMWGNLQKLGNPNLATNPGEMQRMSALRTELGKRARAGDDKAANMLQAAQAAAAVSQSAMMTKGAQKANAAISAATGINAQKVVAQAAMASKQQGRVMPMTNKMQSVSFTDYEEVKKMWVDHYQKGEVPTGFNVTSREEWLKQDIEKSETAITMLGNMNPQVKQKGLELVAALLPFLLLGGFSETETIAYMKAKVEAAKQVLNEAEKQKGMKTQQEEEESLDLTEKKKKEEEKHMHAEVPEDEEKPQGNGSDTEPAPAHTTSEDIAKIAQIAQQDTKVETEK